MLNDVLTSSLSYIVHYTAQKQKELQGFLFFNFVYKITVALQICTCLLLLTDIYMCTPLFPTGPSSLMTAASRVKEQALTGCFPASLHSGSLLVSTTHCSGASGGKSWLDFQQCCFPQIFLFSYSICTGFQFTKGIKHPKIVCC